jgi:hypothetical protein
MILDNITRQDIEPLIGKNRNTFFAEGYTLNGHNLEIRHASAKRFKISSIAHERQPHLIHLAHLILASSGQLRTQ